MTNLRRRILRILPFFFCCAANGEFSVASAEPVCVEESSLCVDDADRIIEGEVVSKPCWRYEKRLRCFEPHDEAGICRAEALPEGCVAENARCTKEDPVMGCLEIETPLTCNVPPPTNRLQLSSLPTASLKSNRTGDLSNLSSNSRGITVGDPVVTVRYAERVDGDDTMEDGCRVTSETCLDDTPREVPVENWPGHVAHAAPACWEKEVTVSCPTSNAATSCKKLEESGCTPTDETRCVAENEGVCIRWQRTYRCGSPVTGEGIETGDPVEIPDGGVAADDSACREALDDALASGLTCEAISSVCEKPGETIIVDGKPVTIECLEKTVVYRCRGEGKNGCTALEALEKDGVCRRESGPDCLQTSEDGTCLLAESIFRCGPTAVPPPDSSEDLGEVEEAPAVPTNGCKEQEASPACRETGRVCTEGPGIRFENGRFVYRDCWAWDVSYTCLSDDYDDCERWEKDPECRLVSSICPEGGDCLRPLRTYECRRPGEDIVLGETCDGEICVGDVCHTTDGPADEDLADSIVQIEIGRQLGLYGDLTGNRFFSGDALHCKDRKGAPSCCRKETVAGMSNNQFAAYLVWGAAKVGWEGVKFVGSPYVYDLLAWSDSTEWLLNALYGSAASGAYSPSFSFWGASVEFVNGEWQFSFSVEGFLVAAALQFWERHKTCDAEDQKLAMARGQGLCHFIGTHCADHVPGLGCTKREEVHVCFNSVLALLINEQGRKQLGRGWGSPEHPDARGFTIEEIESLDFTSMDFTAFIQDVLREVQNSNVADDTATRERIRNRLEEILAGESGVFSSTPPPVYTTNRPPENSAEANASKRLPSFRRPWLERPSPALERVIAKYGLDEEIDVQHVTKNMHRKETPGVAR